MCNFTRDEILSMRSKSDAHNEPQKWKIFTPWFSLIFRPVRDVIDLVYLLQLRTGDECDQNYDAPIANLTEDCVQAMGIIHHIHFYHKDSNLFTARNSWSHWRIQGSNRRRPLPIPIGPIFFLCMEFSWKLDQNNWLESPLLGLVGALFVWEIQKKIYT